MSDRLRGTGLLLRFALRRDRILLPAWVLVLTATVVASAAATGPLYATTADRVAAAEALNASPAIVALYGPILDTSSLGELSMTKMTVLYAAFVAFMSVVLVRRHTRVEEETGRAELVGATAVGVDAPLAAALAEAVLASVVLGVLVAAGNIASGLPVTGSVLFGASWTGIGLVGAGITVLAAQVSSSARTVGFVASGAVGVLYLLRAIGDTSAAVAVVADAVRLGHAAQCLVRAAHLAAGGLPAPRSCPDGGRRRVAAATRPRGRLAAGPRRSCGGGPTAARRPCPRLAPAGDRVGRLDGRHRA